MNVRPLELDLEQYNDKYFPGKYGARYEVDKQLKIIYNNYKKRKFIQIDIIDIDKKNDNKKSNIQNKKIIKTLRQ